MDDYTHLRHLLLESEQQRLDELENRLDDPQRRSRELADVLPDALRAAPDRQQLAGALRLPVEACVKQAVAEDPRPFAKALLPVMGPSINKTLSNALKSIREFSSAQQNQLEGAEQRLADLEQALQAAQQALARLDEGWQRFQAWEAKLNDANHRIEELAGVLPEAIRRASEQVHAEWQAQHPPPPPATDETGAEAGAEEEAEAPPAPMLIHPQAELTNSLQEPVTQCIRQSIHEDANTFADALFPVMGPAIRKAINESIKGLIQSVNQALEQSLSPRGLAWRLEALRTGQRFADIALQHTLVYRVEQVFFIHRESGLLILHLNQEGTEVGDSEAVSAMLTAIQDFIRDSFSASQNDELDSVEIGSYTVWLERGPYAVLASVIRGTAPYHYRQHMRALLETLHARYGRALEHFDGDSSRLEPARGLLSQVLQSELKEEEKNRRQRRLYPALIVLALAAAVGLGGWAYFAYQAWQTEEHYRQRTAAYLQQLENTPGLALTRVEQAGRHLRIRGLRDPLAPDPAQLAAPFGFQPGELESNWQAYHDQSPAFVEKRLQAQLAAWLRPPESVEARLAQGVLHVRGHADSAWIARVQSAAGLFAGLQAVDTRELQDDAAFFAELEARFNAYLQALKNTPGIVVVASGIENGQPILSGLRDPLAPDPEQIAARMGLQGVVMHWSQYQDLTPQFVEQRVRQWLAPPPTVEIAFDNEVLTLRGHAPPDWVDKALNRSAMVVGVSRVEHSGLQTTDQYLLSQAREQLKNWPDLSLSVQQGTLSLSGRLTHPDYQAVHQRLPALAGFAGFDTRELSDTDQEAYQALSERLSQAAIYFTEDTQLAGDQEENLQNLLRDSQAWLDAAARLEQSVGLAVIGYTDGVGTQALNRQLGLARAQLVRDWLVGHGMPVEKLRVQEAAEIRFGTNRPHYPDRRVGIEPFEDG